MEACSRKIYFCYGHRLLGHENKCASMHGHNGEVWIQAVPINGLDRIGRVIDFSILKEKIGGWVDEHWDHTMILGADDKEMINLLSPIKQCRPIFILPETPTAENLAKYLLWEVCPKLLKGCGVIVDKVLFKETENCYAEISLNSKDEKVVKMYM